MTTTAELVLIPAPGMGHIVSMLQLAKLILKRNELISISIPIINLERNLPIHSSKISDYIHTQSIDNPYPTRLTFVTLPPLTTLPDPSLPTIFTDVIVLHKPLMQKFYENRVRSGLAEPAGFVLDMFCTTMLDVASELCVPCYVFLTSGASFLNFVFYSGSLAAEHGLDARDFAVKINGPEITLPVTGLKNPVPGKNIPNVFKDEYGSSVLLNFASQFRKMKGILINTYMELEPMAIQALLDDGDNKTPRVYPVGPILDLERGGGSQDEENESIMKWLDGQPKSSVVFLCFGSMGSFNDEQVKEIANGLEKSGHRFLWSLRKPPPVGQIGAPSDNETFVEALPEGFMDRMADRGKIIGWAPQIDILAHSGIGGFVSHCGWNSTLESVWFGVHIGTWPMSGEQQLNAFELVKELGLAVEIRMDYNVDWRVNTANFLVKSNEVEEGINKLMNIDEDIKGNVREMRDEGRKVLEDGGSSHHWLGCFIDDVSSHNQDLTNIAVN